MFFGIDVRLRGGRGGGGNCPPKIGQNSGICLFNLCKISGKSTPSAYLTKDFPIRHFYYFILLLLFLKLYYLSFSFFFV